jgi:hypothetical protein
MAAVVPLMVAAISGVWGSQLQMAFLGLFACAGVVLWSLAVGLVLLAICEVIVWLVGGKR